MSVSVVVLPEVNIDAAWLAANAPAPYLLKQRDTIYRLQTDVTVDGTAFMVGAPGVKFDLNGHTVTYGNSEPIKVTNGGFEDGLTGWDVTKAATAKTVPARVGMWGSSMLLVDAFTDAQTIVSDPISIPTGGRQYAATITPRGVSDCDVILSVIDLAGNVLGSDRSDSAGRGFSCVAFFTPAAPTSVRLSVGIQPKVDGTPPYSMSLDYAAVFASQDFGIVASPSVTSLPVQLRSLSTDRLVKLAADFTLLDSAGGGLITSGKGRPLGGYAVMAKSIQGLKIRNVRTFVNGMDSMNVFADYAGAVEITGSSHDCDIDNISDRQSNFASLHLAHNSGVIVTDNVVVNPPQAGIGVFENKSGPIEIHRNWILPRAIVANAYGISTAGLTGFAITENVIAAKSGRGILVDGSGKTNTIDGVISGNTVRVYEKPNLEYGNSSECIAFRVRTYGGTQRNLKVTGNVFEATTDADGMELAIGFRLQSRNIDHAMDGANNLFAGNTFTATVNSADKKLGAFGVSIDGIDAGTGTRFEDNTISSNDVSLNLGDENSNKGIEDDIDFVRTKFVALPSEFPRTFKTIQAGLFQNTVRNVRLIDSIYEGGASDSVSFVPSDLLKEVSFGRTAVVIDRVVSQQGK